jgi:peptide/nickel transport system ATP-binding protein
LSQSPFCAPIDKVEFEGQDFIRLSPRKLRAVRPRIQMIFQDPYTSLNPRHRIGRTLTETAIVHGTSPQEAKRRALRILELVGLDDGSMARHPHEFSGGQRQRIGIARALMPQPRIIVADEPVSALEVSVQAQVMELLADIRRRLGLALIFIIHDLRVASCICDCIAVMRQGRLIELGPVEQVLHRPRDPYRASLIASIPGRAFEAGQEARAPG